MTNELALYAIIDNKANDIAAQVISLHRHPAVAVRQFQALVNNPQSPLHQYPDDYDLVSLGSIQHQADTNRLTIVPHWELIITGKAMLAASQPAPAGPELVKEA